MNHGFELKREICWSLEKLSATLEGLLPHEVKEELQDGFFFHLVALKK
jgi:hypothetical protein